jgi:Protein phosphatase 2C
MMNDAARGSAQSVREFRWLGADDMHLDGPAVYACGPLAIGVYGGNTRAGADKNEDAAFALCAQGGAWEFAAVIDAHYSADSARLLLRALSDGQEAMAACLSRPLHEAFGSLQQHLLSTFTSEEFRAACSRAVGEASCLVVARKSGFLWWLSVGDCVGYLLHPRLARLGQLALNQRSFYEWIGSRNTFDLPVPCYTTGTKQLAPGRNVIALTTDGLLEFGKRPFENPQHLYNAITTSERSLSENVRYALNTVHRDRGRDSATIIAWEHVQPEEPGV